MPIVTTGPSGGAPNRLEINDFIKHEKFWSLYVQALHLLQTRGTQDDPGSFFQISSIHGLPYGDWDGVRGHLPEEGVQNEAGGYCTHGNVLFPTWHRPYVSLYEQMIQKYAKEVASTYLTPDRVVWIRAAEELRQPYWDWALNAVLPDEVIGLSRVTITGPLGNKITVDNPLYAYNFHPIDKSFVSPYSNYKSTVRYPTSTNAGATDNVALLKSTLAKNQADYTVKTFNMLSRIHGWPYFSNHTVGDGGSTSNSLEAIHDSIHFGVGGPNGHMTDVALAAFDPVFYLHHCNVDRMLSLWSALNPTVWVTQGNSEDGTWILPADTPIDASTALTPFRNGPDSFWASSGVHDTAKFGYTYPEFNGLDLKNIPIVSDVIEAKVCKLYGGMVSGWPYDWTARIACQKYEVGQSFTVYFFLGVPPEDPAQWGLTDNYVGSCSAFVNSNAKQCANCIGQADIVIEGFVHLDLAITKLSGLKSLNPDVVAPYLTKELQWRVKKTNGEAIDLRSLDVSVYATPMKHISANKFPQLGKPLLFPGITAGRSGGNSSVFSVPSGAPTPAGVPSVSSDV